MNNRKSGRSHKKMDLFFEIREMLFGVGRRKTHRAVFRIRKDRVVVYAIRHLAQDALTSETFERRRSSWLYRPLLAA